MGLYVCFFEFKEQIITAHSTNGICDFQSGFWINDKCAFTKKGDNKYWIPPFKIQYILKEYYDGTEKSISA